MRVVFLLPEIIEGETYTLLAKFLQDVAQPVEEYPSRDRDQFLVLSIASADDVFPRLVSWPL